MISGKVALGGLTLEFGNAERRFAKLTEEVRALTRAQGKLLSEQQKIVERLARAYLPELSPESVSAGLADLRETMEAALADQTRHRADLERRLGRLPEDISRRELILAEAERSEEHAAAALEAVREAVEADLGGDPDHAEHVEEHREIMERRSILKARRARLQTTANVERHAYESDTAFAYLLKRGFGTPEYRGGFFARWLDGRLAARTDFRTLLRNYRVLRTGPHSIQSEIRTLTDRAVALEESIDAQERSVGERHGLPAALTAVATAQVAVLDARAALDQVRSLHDRLAAEIRAVDANRGRPYEDAVHAHEHFIGSQHIVELVEIARSTPDPQDDDLVARLGELRERLGDIGRRLPPLREQLERRGSQTTTLADVTRAAVNRFTSRRSGFSEEFNLGKLVASVIDGTSDSAEIVQRLSEAHERRPLLTPSRHAGDLQGWFAELSSEFDRELGAVTLEVKEEAESEEVVVYDHHGRVLHRRVTRRKP